MLADTAIAVHSQDPRWNWAIGRHVRLPLTGRLIPIIADDILVDPKFGTGVVKVTPAHDPNDYAVWQRHKGQPDEIDILNLLTPDGRINSDRPEWSKYAGMKRDAARKQVVEDLKAAGLLEKEEPYETQVGHSDRSKTPIEPYLSDQWFVKMAPLAEPALQVVREGKIKFHPERHAQQYLSWLGEKRDWPVSRQLWWGHRIPVWIFLWNGPRADSPSDSQEVRMELPYLSHQQNQRIAVQIIRPGEKSGDILIGISVAPGHPEIEQLIEKHGGRQDPDVLDTWFSSALWPHSTLGWPERTPELQRYYPTSVLVTGRDIITLWVARMVMMGMYNMGAAAERVDRITGVPPVPSAREVEESDSATAEPNPHGRDARDTTPADARVSEDPQHEEADRAAARRLGLPFLDVAINPTILDGKGERMSKQKGNGVDPVDIIEAYGADALRFTLTKMATDTQDARMPVKRDAQGRNTSEKFDEGRNFCNKLWNACRFALGNLEGVECAEGTKGQRDRGTKGEEGTRLVDRWIVSRFNRAVAECDQALAAYRFDVYAKSCYDFFWRDFCDWYVEAIKPAMKDPARAPQTAGVLAAVLDGALRLMHPMIPFITETVWWRLNDVRPVRGLAGRVECPPSKRLVLAQWPRAGALDESAEQIFPKLQELIGAIRTVRNDRKISPKQTVAVSIRAPGDLAEQIESNRELIELLATCTLNAVVPDLPAVANATLVTSAGCDIHIEGLPSAGSGPDAARLAKEIADKQRSIDSLRGRLRNESYLAKAPPELVQQTRDQLAAAEADLAKLQAVP